MTCRVFDSRTCQLGEGPLWHPERKQLFWFDILDRKLMTRDASGPKEWQYEDTVSAAGWVDDTTVIMASATGLWRVTLTNGARQLICPLEQTNSKTRSNDGRADPWGGFWIGTMGYAAEPGVGAIYRYYQGSLRKLFGDITISNAICFAPDRSCAYYTDTPTRQVMRVPLDRNGWPDGDAAVFADLSAEELNPDGAVVDASGTVWIALWGAAQVAAYGPDGRLLRTVDLPAHHVTCPAFGGEDFKTLYVPSALQNIPASVQKEAPEQGMTFSIEGLASGVPEPRVLL